MLDFKIIHDPQKKQCVVQTSLNGKPLLTTPQLNKGTAFTEEERHTFGLLGKLPARVETLEEQVHRAYQQFKSYTTLLQQNIYLNNLHDKNQVLFYKLLHQHVAEMLHIIYTPIVGTAVKRFSQEYRQPRGLYIAYSDRAYMEEIIANRSNPEIDLIVVTDGESVLGIGDQGIGAMDIPVAKLMVYTICGGIDPTRTLPVFLDVGTNNQTLLDDPLYLGCRHPRISQNEYDAFIATFVEAIHKKFPQAFLHWEDFGRGNARRLLDYYQNTLCTFNDDIQGTGAVTLAAILAACSITKKPLAEHCIVIFGAGSAGTGIADQMVDYLTTIAGLTYEQACQCFWLVDRQGLLFDNDKELTEAQQPYARPIHEKALFIDNQSIESSITLRTTIKTVQPSILIGCSAQTSAFTQEIIEMMASAHEQPIIFPLSNPDEKCEATPTDIVKYSQGKALIATGTAFQPVSYCDTEINIAQCNNALIFPGIGLGVLAVAAKKLTKSMILKAAETLSSYSPTLLSRNAPLLPPLADAQIVAKKIAIAVAHQAIAEGLAEKNNTADLAVLIDKIFWEPQYLPFQRIL